MTILAPRSAWERETPLAEGSRSAPTLRSTPLVPILTILFLTLGAWAALLVQAWRVGGDDAFMTALCSASGAQAGVGLLGIVADAVRAAGVWAAMSIAMMLPTLVPLVASYQDRARGRADRAPSPVWLIVGYLLVWSVVASAAGIVQALWLQAASRVSLPPVVAGVLSGAVIGAAGLYQFSELKDRFLAACRHEASADSAERSVAGVVRLGVEHGLRCVGCCAAVMSLMLVAGAMNLFWMACFTLLMTIERLTQGRWAPVLIGAGLLLTGAAVALSAVGITPILRWAVG